MNRSRMTSFSVLTGRLILALLLLVVSNGCLPPDREFSNPQPEPVQDVQHGARLNGFLTLKDNQGPAIRLEVAGIEVLAEDVWLPLTRGPFTLDSAVIGTGQRFLGGLAVPPGHYQRLRMTVTKGELQTADGDYTVIAPEPFLEEMTLASGLSVEEGDSRTLLLTWNVEGSIQPDNSLRLAMTATPPLRQFLMNLVFVSCPASNTVFVVRADNNWVVDSFGVTGRPTYLAIDPDPSRQRLYVLAVRDRMVKVVDLSSFRVVDFYPVPLNDEPTFMTISPDGQAAFLLDARSGYLSRMDLSTGRSVARVLLGYQPEYAAYLSEQNLLAVSLSLSQRVLLLDPLTLATVRTITTGNAPEGLAVADRQLYIAESGGNTVSIYDLGNRNNQSRLAVGFGPRRLLDTDNQIYVSNYQDGSLSVLVPGQLGVIQEIFGFGRPLEMAFVPFYRRLYVADEEAADLAVIDANSNQVLGHISLGARPLGLAVIQ
jgi:YVTN family beta-propeller protein